MPGARLNDTVTAGSWLKWFTLNGDVPAVSFVTEVSGTSVVPSEAST